MLRARWKLIIVFYLFRDGTLRLSELERAIPRITQKMLIQQLRGLARHGVVRQANPRTFMARLVGSIGQRLPTMFIFKIYVQAGGLISYGIDPRPIFRQLAFYVGKILNGTKPADLPVEQAVKFELMMFHSSH